MNFPRFWALILCVGMWACGLDALTPGQMAKFQSTPASDTFVQIDSDVSITIDPNDSEVLLVTSNGIPAHEAYGVGSRQILPQSYSWKINRHPVQQETPTCLPRGAVGIGLNGVPFYGPYTSGCCDAGAEELDLFDVCWGHPDGQDRYHYHVAPQCTYILRCNKPSGIVGVAFDGFPIFGPNDENGNLIDPNDLDECNGMEDSNGNYRYHLTTTFPYVIGCFRGEVDAQFIGINSNCACESLQDPCENLNGKRRRRKRELDDFTCCTGPASQCEYVRNE